MANVLPLGTGLSYILLPGSLAFDQSDARTRTLHEKAYLYWKDFWTQVFTDNGERRELTSDDFMRQDLVTLIMHQDEIIGMHLYSFFDVTLESTKQHTYFLRSYNPFYMDYLKQHARTAMSWEYLTVDPKWRKSQTGISFAMVLVGLATKIQRLFQVDVGIAVSRSDVKVTQMALEYGAKIVLANVNKHNTPCDLVACHLGDIKTARDETIRATADSLWNQRVDLTGLDNFIKYGRLSSQEKLKITG